MSIFVVLATGESLTGDQVEFVRQKHEKGICKAIAVSDSYKLALWADGLVSNDSAWWRVHSDAMKFAGRKFCGTSYQQLERLKADGNYSGGTNSGLQAMRAAQLMGATKILLLGFDMKGTHYFGKHPAPLRNTTANRFKVHIAQFRKWNGCPVVNCTTNSALKSFPMSTIEQQLQTVQKIAEPTNRRMSAKHQRLYVDYYASRVIQKQPSRWLHRVEALAKQFGVQTILDYGCGAGRGISSFSNYKVSDYDPGVPGCAGDPVPADLVVSIHALEHVEPEYVDAVIDHMTKLAVKALFIVVSCEPSTKLLPDGSAWHSFVRSAQWWRKKLSAFDSQPVLMDRQDAEYAAMRLTAQQVQHEERSAIAM